MFVTTRQKSCDYDTWLHFVEHNSGQIEKDIAWKKWPNKDEQISRTTAKHRVVQRFGRLANNSQYRQ